MKNARAIFAIVSLLFASTVQAAHPVNPALHLQDDVVRDGRADIIFQGGTALAYWTLAGSGPQPAITSAYAGDAGPGYKVVAVSDFDGDGSADVMWTNGSHLKLWINNGTGGYTPVSVGTYGGGWVPFAARDINGDGKSDLFFRGSTHLAYWLMDGPTVTASSYAGDGGAGWRVVAINRFFLRSAAQPAGVDVLWTNGSQFKFWYGNAATRSFSPYSSSLIGSYGGGWEPFGAGDINGDGTADIMFRAGTHIAYWLIFDPPSNGSFPFAESRYGGMAVQGSAWSPSATTTAMARRTSCLTTDRS